MLFNIIFKTVNFIFIFLQFTRKANNELQLIALSINLILSNLFCELKVKLCSNSIGSLNSVNSGKYNFLLKIITFNLSRQILELNGQEY